MLDLYDYREIFLIQPVCFYLKSDQKYYLKFNHPRINNSDDSDNLFVFRYTETDYKSVRLLRIDKFQRLSCGENLNRLNVHELYYSDVDFHSILSLKNN